MQSAEHIAGAAFCDAVYQVPRADALDYVPRLRDICQRERVKVLIPIADPEVAAVAHHQAEFRAEGIEPIVASARVVDLCNDKLATSNWLAANGFPAPGTWLVDEVVAPQTLPYPLFVKPRVGFGSVGARRVDSPEELMLLRQRTVDLVAQELLEGDEFTTDVLSDSDGRAFAIVPRRRVEVKAGICYKGWTCHDDQLIEWGRRIVAALGLSGPANLQCMVTETGPSYFEINPRFSATLPLTIAAGVNGPLWVLRLALGESAPKSAMSFRDVTMVRYWSEVFRHIEVGEEDTSVVV